MNQTMRKGNIKWIDPMAPGKGIVFIPNEDGKFKIIENVDYSFKYIMGADPYKEIYMWQTCPICGGKEIVSGDFYTSIGQFGVSSNITEMCRTCNGKGIISTLNGLPPQ